MMDFKDIYFVGIGGIGMSALARYFHKKGYHVSGYDKVQTKLTNTLVAEGIEITYRDDLQELPASIIENKSSTLIVYTPAIPKENRILAFFMADSFTVLKRAKLLAMISEKSLSVGVAGTHGKTTTASILAHILYQSELGCNAFLGGIANNYDSNLLLHDASEITVLEADEYDRSFLNLTPPMAVITSMDPDHLDIYSEVEEFRKSFLAYAECVKENGLLVYHQSLKEHFEKYSKRTLSYGIGQDADIAAVNVRVEDGVFRFDVSIKEKVYSDFSLGLPGNYNVENALAAIAISYSLDLEMNEIRDNLKSYAGVYRRFQYQYRSEEITYVDDYAHHPTEIKAVYQAARQLFPTKKLTCVFQPHLFSRTKDFMSDFAEILSKFDEIILLEIYPAREKPMPGITSKTLLELVTNANKSLFAKEELLEHIIGKELEVLFTLGAGDIDTLVKPLKDHFIGSN